MPRPTLLALAASAALVLTAVPAADASPASRKSEVWAITPASTIAVDGHGYGHGRGMSQYGSEGAARAGLTSAQIMDFYYPGTTAGQLGGQVKVWISADRDNAVTVVARPGLKVRDLVTKQKTVLPDNGATKWRLTAGAGMRTVVSFFKQRWVKWRTVKGDAELSAGGQPITLILPTGKVAYRGALASRAPKPGKAKRVTVNRLPLDSYLKGVVPRETFTSWSPAALESQAIAARTYAAFERADPASKVYQICDTTSCQVYGGFTAEYASTNTAIEATAGQVRLDAAGQPAFTQFSSSNGGFTRRGLAALPRRAAGPVRRVVRQHQQQLDPAPHRRQRREELPRHRHPHLDRRRHPRRQRGVGRPRAGHDPHGYGRLGDDHGRGLPVPGGAEVVVVHAAGDGLTVGEVLWHRVDLPDGMEVEHLADESPGRVVVGGLRDGTAYAAWLTGSGELTEIPIPPEAAAHGSARVVRTGGQGVMGVCGSVGLWGCETPEFRGLATEMAAYPVPRDERGIEAAWLWVTAGDDQLVATAAYPTADGHELRVLDLFTRLPIPVERRLVTGAPLDQLHIAAFAGRVTVTGPVSDPGPPSVWWSTCALLDPAEYRPDPVPWLADPLEGSPVRITDGSTGFRVVLRRPRRGRSRRPVGRRR